MIVIRRKFDTEQKLSDCADAARELIFFDFYDKAILTMYVTALHNISFASYRCKHQSRAIMTLQSALGSIETDALHHDVRLNMNDAI